MQRKRGTGRGPRVVATVDERTKALIVERSEALGWSESSVVAEMIMAGIESLKHRFEIVDTAALDAKRWPR